MASIDKRPDGRYRARWREYPNAPQRTKTFTRKRDAELFLAEVQHRLLAGTYTPPEAGKITVSAYAEEWLHRRHWAASTAESVERMLRLHILPELGRWPLAGLRRAHIEEWAAALPLAPSSVRTLHRMLSSLLASAVEDERIPRNPASRARLPKAVEEQVVPMTVDEVRALTGAMVEHVRAAVVVAAGTGLRQGELFGLTVDRIDFLRRELRVDRQLWSPRIGAAGLRCTEVEGQLPDRGAEPGRRRGAGSASGGIRARGRRRRFPHHARDAGVSSVGRRLHPCSSEARRAVQRHLA